MLLPAVGLALLPEPLRGSWTLPDFPELVTVLDRTFRRSTTWAAPTPGVVAQYREDVDRNSLHLLVHADRSWVVEHSDDANPERGLVLEHAVRDVLQTTGGALAFSALVLGLSAGLSYLLTRR